MQHTHSQPRKMVQTKDDLVIMYEANYGLRQIYTDGRKLPANNPQPWWFGYSDITMNDSKAYTRPWTVRVNQRLIPGDQLIEFVCNENEQSSKHYDR